MGSTLDGIGNRLIEHGYSAADAAVRAPAQVYAILQQQAAMLAFLDCFWLLGLVAFVGPLLAIFVRRFNQGGKAPAH
jgi:DHA2 family multidrug resistance protein